MMRKYLAILGLLALLTQLLAVGLYQPAGLQAQELDSGDKTSSLLTLQVEAKLRAAEVGGVSTALAASLQAGRVDILQTPGINLEDLSQQRIFVHLAQKPARSQVDTITKKVRRIVTVYLTREAKSPSSASTRESAQEATYKTKGVGLATREDRR